MGPTQEAALRKQDDRLFRDEDSFLGQPVTIGGIVLRGMYRPDRELEQFGDSSIGTTAERVIVSDLDIKPAQAPENTPVSLMYQGRELRRKVRAVEPTGYTKLIIYLVE